MKNKNYFFDKFEDFIGWPLFFIGVFLWLLIGHEPSNFNEFISEADGFFKQMLELLMAFLFISSIIGMFFTLVGIGSFIRFIFCVEIREIVNTVSEQKPKNLVYEYTQPATRTRLPRTDQAPDRKLPPEPSVLIEKILPPESFFSVPRKIDWDTLNKTRKHHGDLGEMFVCDLEKNYLTKVDRADLAERVHHVASQGDGHGYDIQSFNKDGSKKFIEVKATNSSTGSSFNISKNEFSFLQSHLSNAFVYHVHNVNNERETTVVVYPAGEILNSPNISPSGYVVKM